VKTLPKIQISKGLEGPPAPLWLEERIREALAEPAEATTLKQFASAMDEIAHGR
jgi:hypothetical protein